MKIRKNGVVVNLTESDLRRIVKRTLRESSHEDFMGRMGSGDEEEISQQEMVGYIADFFRDEVFSNNERSLAEDDEDEDLGSRADKFKEKAMIGGGLGTAGAGLAGLMGSAMGWSDLELTSKIHEYVDALGLGNYSGPISMAMIAAGIALAFAGRSKQLTRTGK